MPARYVTPARPRHRIDRRDGVEQIVIPARRNWFAILFLPLWLTGWTIGGGAAITQLMSGDLPAGERAFMAVWLCGWIAGWLFAVGTLAWQFVGAERIAAAHGDLTLSLGIGRLARTRRFRGGEVRAVRVAGQPAWAMFGGGMGPFWPSMTGTLRFDHGARTIAFASGIDEAEAATVRDWLLARLPGARARD
ncbi:hypothetical protein [uncultured Sphingomonas sp.]|uniref:hypothetical protein n=1 Tax=uncultured Sphingomonas sp. TaxID=158754 RepID=UPI0025DDAA1C|nr:hypothetical protein [uncultured Sphingomonas sp.]